MKSKHVSKRPLLISSEYIDFHEELIGKYILHRFIGELDQSIYSNVGYPFVLPNFWIGGNDLARFKTWVWSRGTTIDCPGCYTNWVPQVQGILLWLCF